MPEEKKRKYHRSHDRERSPFQGNVHTSSSAKRARKNERHPEEEKDPLGRRDAVSLSIEDSNALRASLGLAPLEAGEESGHRDNQTENFVHLPAKDLRKIRESEDIKERLKTHKEKRQLYEKYCHTQLVDSTEKDVPVMSWVDKIRERERTKKLAEERDKVLAEMDEQFNVPQLVESALTDQSKSSYKSSDLAGLKIGHDVNRFVEGKTVVLTLKDKEVLDDDESEVLINVNLVDDEHADRNRENLRKNAGLAGIADEENEDVLLGLRSKGILEKYDSEIHGTKQPQFSLGSHGTYDPQHERAMQQLKAELEGGRQSLPDIELHTAAEYYTPEEMDAKFKKRKRRVKVRARSAALTADSLDVDGSTSTTDLKKRTTEPHDNPEGVIGSSQVDPDDQVLNLLEVLHRRDRGADNVDFGDENIHEDDELRNELERTINRVAKCKSAITIKPEEVAAQLLTRQPVENKDDSRGSGVVFDATAEFYKSIGTGMHEPVYHRPAPRIDHRQVVDKREEEDESRSVYLMGGRRIPKKGEEPSQKSTKDEEMSDESDDDDDREKPSANRWQTVDGRDVSGRRIGNTKSKPSAPSLEQQQQQQQPETSDSFISGVLDDEPRLDTGVFSALQLAEKKGYLEKDKTKRTGAGTMVNLMAKHFVEEQVRYDDIDAKFSKRDRFSGPLSDFKELRHYKPDVKLEYVDDLGRQLNAKEAFRQLSHKFHGKGSSKNKTEKRMKKIKEEFLLKASTSSDTPLGTAEKLNKKLQSIALPYVILSGKNAAVKNLTK